MSGLDPNRADWRETTPRPAEPPLKPASQPLPRLRLIDILALAALGWLALILMVRFAVTIVTGE